MLYVLTWLFIFGLLTVWSLAAWAMHAIAVWAVSNAGTMTSAASGFEGPRLPEWLTPWGPPEIAQSMTLLLSGLAQVLESLLQTMPALASGLTIATWVIWCLGSMLLVVLGSGLHLLVAMWCRRDGGSGPQSAVQVAA